MELPELQQGLQNIQQADASSQSAPYSLDMDSLMGGFGNWFGNDKSLGELLLQQLRSKGVDTQAATEAMLRELLGGLVDDLNMLQQKLSGFTSAIQQEITQAQAVTDSVTTALDMSGASPMAQNIMPPESPMNDLPQDMGLDMGPMPPEAGASGVPPEAGASDVPPEAGASDVPPEAGASDVPPEAGASDVPPEATGTGTVSDANLKEVISPKYIISDANLKKIKSKIIKPKGVAMNANILAACRGGF